MEPTSAPTEPPPLPRPLNTIHYQLTAKEAIQSLIKHKLTTRRRLTCMGQAIAGALFIVGGNVTTSPKESAFLITFGCLGMVVAFLGPIILYRAINNVVKQNPQFTAPKTLSFDESKISVSQPTQKSDMFWNAFKKVTQDDRYVYLHLDNTGTVSTIPKRAFDADTLTKFLQCSQSGIARSAP